MEPHGTGVWRQYIDFRGHRPSAFVREGENAFIEKAADFGIAPFLADSYAVHVEELRVVGVEPRIVKAPVRPLRLQAKDETDECVFMERTQAKYAKIQKPGKRLGGNFPDPRDPFFVDLPKGGDMCGFQGMNVEFHERETTTLTSISPFPHREAKEGPLLALEVLGRRAGGTRGYCLAPEMGHVRVQGGPSLGTISWT